MRLPKDTESLSCLFGLTLALVILVPFRNVAATAICDTCPDPKRFQYPGVGFDLTLDYGTAVVQFPNGTFIDVAKVEGSPAYKRDMRSANFKWSSTSSHHYPQQTVSWKEPWSSAIGRSAGRLLFYLGSWPSFRKRDVPPIQAMLHALRTTLESFLDTRLNTSNLAAPEYFSDRQRSLLASAFEAEGLQRSRPSFSTVGGAASRANGIGRCKPASRDCEKAEPQIYLTVDYSRSSLTLISWVEEYTVSEYFNCLHDLNLGADTLTKHPDSEKGYWTSVKQLIEKAAKLSDSLPDDYKYITSRAFSQVVLLGDRVMDKQLLIILRDVLGPALISEATLGDGGSRAGFVDPVFAAARGVAAGSREMINHGRWDCEAPSYCDEKREMGNSEL